MRAILRGAALALILLAGCSGEENEETGLDRGGVPSLPPVPYAVRFPEDLPPDLAALLPGVAETEQKRAEPPDSRLGIRQRAEGDIERIQQALRAEGYYDGKVGFELAEPDGSEGRGPIAAITEAPPQVVVRFSIVPGPRYTYGNTALALGDNPDGFVPPATADLGLVSGEPARTQPVIDADAEVLRRAREAGFALAKTGQREVVVDHDTRRMEVTLRLDPGRRASFGDVAFTGSKGIDEGFLRSQVPFAKGERYDPELVDESQSNLFDTDLFSTIIIRPAETLTTEGFLDYGYELRQRPQRSVGAAVGFQTDQGPNTRLFWEHRNFFGAGERFRTQLDASLVEQSLSVSLDKPDFWHPRQNLVNEVTLRNQDLDAYKATSLGAGTALEREFTDNLTGSLGIAFRYASIEDQLRPREEFALLSLPASIDWDFANDRFSPTGGGTVQLTGAPYVDLLEPSRRFFKARLTHTRYLSLVAAPQVVLALRGSLGTLFGVDTERVPADERFYAGGGGSIRGIAYQKAGPLDENDDPLGGRSVAEGSVELRLRLRNDLGAVLFVDGGTVFDDPVPGGGERVLFGAGPGLRYFTPIGPVRLDVGFPLNPRSGVDDAFQLYISIGQAF